jgi:hypothetical protein
VSSDANLAAVIDVFVVFVLVRPMALRSVNTANKAVRSVVVTDDDGAKRRCGRAVAVRVHFGIVSARVQKRLIIASAWPNEATTVDDNLIFYVDTARTRVVQQQHTVPGVAPQCDDSDDELRDSTIEADDVDHAEAVDEGESRWPLRTLRRCVRALASGVVLGAPVLLHGSALIDADLLVRLAVRLGCAQVHVVRVSARDLTAAAAPNAKSAVSSPVLASFEAVVGRAARLRPCVLWLRDVDALAGETADNTGASIDVLRDALAACAARGVLLVCAVRELRALSDATRALFASALPVEGCNERERSRVLAQLWRAKLRSVSDVDVAHVARECAGASRTELDALVAHIAYLSVTERDDESAPHDVSAAVTPVSSRAITAALDVFRTRIARGVGAPRVQEVRWSDVGGLDDVKRELLLTLRLPLERPELFANGVRMRSGVLLHGPPGSGKVRVRACARASDASTVDFVGESCCNRVLAVVSECERSRTTEHVRWRKRAQRARGVCQGTSRARVCVCVCVTRYVCTS